MRGAGVDDLRRLGVLSLGFWRQRWLRDALRRQGWRVVPGWQDCEAIGVWGRGGVAARGIAVARRRGLPPLTIEDSFLRSVHPGLGPAAGLILDPGGVHYDATSDSRVAAILNAGPVPDGDTADALDLLRHHRLSKYNHWPDLPCSDPAQGAALPDRFVLVVDQVAGDAALSGAGRADFAQMLAIARARNPETPVLVRPHPSGRGLLTPAPALPFAVNPWDIWSRVTEVHVHSSQLGLEAILAGHRPVVHGRPIYAGWGLSEDLNAPAGRTAQLDMAQLFAGLMRDASIWPDPVSGRDRGLLRAVEDLAAVVEAHRRTTGRSRLRNVSAWKRARVARMLGRTGAPVTVGWGPDRTADARIEDGFIRSRGLGAALVPPVSLIHDRRGIHFDPTRPSDLEAYIAASPDLPAAALRRAARLRQRLVAGGIGKYNLSGPWPALPPGRRILIAGQVPGDASVRCGGPNVTDADVIAMAREAEPDAVLLYKPHPDIVAGLRSGAPAEGADMVVGQVPLPALLDQVEGLWTNTSLAGFEALLRGVPVTCLGLPFYAGWGLTEDRADISVSRRRARPDLDMLTHAALIDYPIYIDPQTLRRCGPEQVVSWLEAGGMEPSVPLAGPGRMLSRLLRYATRT